MHAVWAGASPVCADYTLTGASRHDGRTGDSRSGSGGQAARIDRRSEGSLRPRNFLRGPASVSGTGSTSAQAARPAFEAPYEHRWKAPRIVQRLRAFTSPRTRRSWPIGFARDRPEMAARAICEATGVSEVRSTLDRDGQQPSREPIERAEADRRARFVVGLERASPRSACRRREPPDPLRVPRGPREHGSAGAGSQR